MTRPPHPLLWLLLLTCHASRSLAIGLVYRTGCCPRDVEIPDTAKKTTYFIEEFGYTAESHEIVTEDDYIVTVHRVVADPSEIPELGPRPAVLIQHGIAASTVLWLLSQERSLPFVLANAGFDVWLMDTRGNAYSKKHAYLPSSDARYWRFSFHEQGVYDLPAAVDYITSLTGNEKIFYIGHSRGTTMALALLATRPEYNEKFFLVNLYAPVAYVRHVSNPLVRFLFNNPLTSKIQMLLKGLGAYLVPGSSDASIQFRKIVCNRTQLTCMDLIFAFGGFDYELLNKTMIPVYLAHYPEGGATQEYVHYLQIGNTDEFRQFDYGPEVNLNLYGSTTPPSYDLSQITAPIALYHADNDFLVRPDDLNRLRNQLRSIVSDYRVPFKKFTHTDFMWATKANEYVYGPTVDLMTQFLQQ